MLGVTVESWSLIAVALCLVGTIMVTLSLSKFFWYVVGAINLHDDSICKLAEEVVNTSNGRRNPDPLVIGRGHEIRAERQLGKGAFISNLGLVMISFSVFIQILVIYSSGAETTRLKDEALANREATAEQMCTLASDRI